MAIRKVRVYGDPVLRKRCAEVDVFDGDLSELVEDMIDTMYAYNGVGLAANQVGVSLRLAVFDLGYVKGNGQEEILTLVNPEIVETSGRQKGEEGCLSLPGVSAELERPMTVTVRARDVEGKAFETTGEGLLARAFCHELEHLDGKLFIDHLSPRERRALTEDLKKIAQGV